MMDALKMRSAAKAAKISSVLMAQKKAESKLNDDEKKTIAELKALFMDTIQLDVQLQRQIYNLEKSFEAKHNEIFDKRRKVLEEIRKREQGDAVKQPNLVGFWVKVLKASYTEFISKKDEKILMHLSDIRSHLFNDPAVKFVIEFHFDVNEYFSNRILSKTYYLNCLPDVEDPLSFDGAEIFKCEGCVIDWKTDNRDKDTKAFSSFFDFFTPPQLPSDPDDPNYYDINSILQNDFELGFYLKERVIPKAILFFTGEIVDCQTSDDDTEDTDDDDFINEDDQNREGNKEN